MATAKITITLDRDQLGGIRNLVASGKAPNVSAFIKHAVAIALQDAEGWAGMLTEALHETGGPLTKRERDWADGILAPARAKPKRSRSAA